MNKFELFFYNILQYNPKLKQIVRNLYQSFFDFMPRKDDFFSSAFDYKEDYFFGFHDISPFSFDSSKILSNKLIDRSFKLMYKAPIEVGYFKFRNSKFLEFIKIDSTYMWNYHKGCRLQWLSDNKIIFNTISSESNLISKIYDISSNSSKLINYPIDSTSKCGNFATSFSYERLEKFMPGYGYRCKDESFIDEKYPKNTGLYLVDLNSNSAKLIISLYELVTKLYATDIFDNCFHYVTHSQFSNDGRYISFLHRWTQGDYRKRSTNLIIYDLENKSFLKLPTDFMVSHYVWNMENQILAYCKIKGTNCHAIFNVPNINEYKIVSPKILNSDGHQTFINNSNFITDTYPDKYRNSKLYQVDIIKDQVNLIASLYSPKKFQTKDFSKHIACDLHPRVSPCNKFVCFDSPRTGVRAIYIMQINLK